MRGWSSTTPSLVGTDVVAAPRLGDHDRGERGAEAGAEHDQPLAQRVGHDRPAEVGGGVADDVAVLPRQLRALGRRGHLHRVVVVDAVEVERLADRRQVAGLHDVLHQRREVGGVATQQHRLEEQAVPHRVEDLARPDVGVVVAGRPHRGVVVGAADRGRTGAAQLDGGAAVGDEHVVRGPERVEEQRPPGGVHAHAVAEERGDVGLVDRHPVLDAVGEPLADDRGVVARSARRWRG